ncbi:MAG: hypothetical protein JWN38_1097 [Candidatus Saccharibacteria bacterium]|nr:hypothetical protein [Candidatus Saccharibacteria bacterium]
MILGSWARDAEKLVSYLPSDELVAQRADYLLSQVLPRSVPVKASFFDQTAFPALPPNAFLAADRQDLAGSRSKLGQIAVSLPGVAFVAHGEGVPSVLALPVHDPSRRFGNGSILLHELMHITENEVGLTTASHGRRERRAYQMNTDILSALDGTDFQTYLDNWPVQFTQSTTPVTSQTTQISVDILFHDMTCPVPPKETFAHEMWKEDGTSRQVLQHIGRASVFEKLTMGLEDSLVNILADDLHDLS